MRCLDVGCGIGAVTLKLARWVGPTGQAVGIDSDAWPRRGRGDGPRTGRGGRGGPRGRFTEGGAAGGGAAGTFYRSAGLITISRLSYSEEWLIL